MEDNDITSRLKAIRMSLGMNQKEFGERMGMALTTWASIEQGRNSLNERARLLLEKIYFVNPEYLDTGKGPIFLRPTHSDENIFFSPPSNFGSHKAMLIREDDLPENRRKQSSLFDPEYHYSGIAFSESREPRAAAQNIPCLDCREKAMEISRLRQLLERLEDEVTHQRKVIDHLMEVQKNQNRPT